MKTVIAIRTTNRGTWRELFSGMSDFAKSCDWNLQPADARRSVPDMPALIDFWEPSGFILDASGGSGNLPLTGVGNLPTVVINPDDPLDGNFISLGSDPAEIARLAMGELLSLNPASLVFIEWWLRRDWCLHRMQEARRIATLHGMPLTSISPGDASVGSLVSISHICNEIQNLPRPIGIFAVSDDIAVLAIAAAIQLGLAIPGEAAIVSVDDDPEVCENCTPTLTSIRPDYRRLGFEAASALDQLVQHPELRTRKRKRMRFVPLYGLVKRASTEAASRKDPLVAEAIETIRLHACDGLTAARVVKHWGVSLHTAEDHFKNATGMTIGASILERRFAAACGYLRERRSSIDAIAGFCGWNSSAAFRKAFKARFGTSPLKWRNGVEK